MKKKIGINDGNGRGRGTDRKKKKNYLVGGFVLT